MSISRVHAYTMTKPIFSTWILFHISVASPKDETTIYLTIGCRPLTCKKKLIFGGILSSTTPQDGLKIVFDNLTRPSKQTQRREMQPARLFKHHCVHNKQAINSHSIDIPRHGLRQTRRDMITQEY